MTLGDNPHGHGKTPRFLRDNPQSARSVTGAGSTQVVDSAADSAPSAGGRGLIAAWCGLSPRVGMVGARHSRRT